MTHSNNARGKPAILWVLIAAGSWFILDCQAIVEFKDPPDTCGDNTIQNWEDCDGQNLGDHNCESLGEGSGTLSCTGDCHYDVSQCMLSTCNNGQLDPGEDCDGQDLNGQSCVSRGYSDGQLVCSSTCHFDESGCGSNGCLEDNYCDPVAGETRDNCPSDCVFSCGNGICEIGRGESFHGEGSWEACWDDCRWHRITAGAGHTCALMFDRSAWCWGDNYNGQLGSTDGPSAVPVQVETNTKFVEIAAGWNHTCGVDEGGGVWCWGGNDWGQLGDNSVQQSNLPVPVQGIMGTAQTIASGSGVSCATTEDGSGFCWGVNKSGELGVGPGMGEEDCNGVACSRTALPVPVPEPVFEISISLADQDKTHVCARSIHGHALCWGVNDDCQNGHNTNQVHDATPFMVPVLEGLNTVVAGDSFSCAVNSSGLHCWGSDERGQIGNSNGPEGTCISPVQTLSLAMVQHVAAGGKHGCAWEWQGLLWCWGDNTFGQTGDGIASYNDAPFQVGPVQQAVVVSAGFHHTCAIEESGAAVCWGDNFAAQLGNGTNDSSHNPVLVLDPLYPWQGARR